ncbi:MAG TPA: hypothetical protein VEW91_07840 [bacterium]|nr:hypothetical protein [bacterium]
MKRKEFLVTAAGVAATLAASTAALAQTTAPTQPQNPTRGETGSARNIKKVRYMVERLIDELQHDQRDYGGYRVKAIAQLQQARADLDQALQWDATHPQ